MNVRQVALLARRSERERVTRRLTAGHCPSCGKRVYPVGPYLICRNLRCSQLVAEDGYVRAPLSYEGTK